MSFENINNTPFPEVLEHGQEMADLADNLNQRLLEVTRREKPTEEEWSFVKKVSDRGARLVHQLLTIGAEIPQTETFATSVRYLLTAENHLTREPLNLPSEDVSKSKDKLSKLMELHLKDGFYHVDVDLQRANVENGALALSAMIKEMAVANNHIEISDTKVREELDILSGSLEGLRA